jgi:4-hydroxybenzoate polyprenyltransferase
MKLGLGDSYDNVSVLSKKTRAYLDLTQPASTVGIGVGVFIASLFFSVYTETALPISEIIFVSATSMAAHGGSQALNQAEDAEMDRNTPHKKNRPVPSGVVSEEEARSVAWILIFLAIGRAFIQNTTFGLMIIIVSFFGVFYNLEPIRAKERIISIPWQAVSRGLLFFPLIWSAYGNLLQPVPWTLGVFMFWYVFAFQNTADIIDKETDEQYGVKTFVVVFGVRRTAMIASAGVMMMMATVGLSVSFGILETYFFWMLAILPFCALMVYYMSFHPDSVSSSTGNHPAYLLYYFGLVLAITIPLITVYTV